MNNSMNPKLYCLHYNECDPKKCTALKLKKFGLIKIISKNSVETKNAIFLTPLSNKTITFDDRAIILNHGVIAIDCSWKRLFEAKIYSYRNKRKLPPLIAANPINYGKWEQLSTVEALAASLYLTGFEDYADNILSKFNWGQQFKLLNNL